MARNRRNCLNPPPSCFSRAPPAPTGEGEKGIQITYAPLPAPIILRSPNSNDLAKAITTGRAFPSKPPPLLSHDVQREDWNKLWDDIDETARIEMRASAGLSVATRTCFSPILICIPSYADPFLFLFFYFHLQSPSCQSSVRALSYQRSRSASCARGE
jgi:hypothetical protein